MSGKCSVRLRVVFVALALVITIIVSMPLPASAGSYELCLGSCAIGSYANSPACMDRRVQCLTPSSSAQSSNPNNYGAIAYSKTARSYGVGSNYLTQKQADSAAMSRCATQSNNAGDCAVEVRFSSTCAALARTISGIIEIEWAKNSSRTVAESDALSGCEKENGQTCKPVTSECSP
jgi:hypothetical protein